MSELKIYKRSDILQGHWFTEYCRKDEADKVIAEKDSEIAELKADYDEVRGRLQTANLIKDEQLAAVRHQKHKRCLAMAMWCASRSASWCFDPADEQLHKSEFYDKYKHRWLELAEQFKGAK